MLGERPEDGAADRRDGSSGETRPARGREVRFSDRHDAGRRLALLLEPYAREQPVVVGLPRGGVAVAAEVASALGAPLDVVVVRKIGAPQNSEYAIGAVAEGGVRVLGRRVGRAADLSGPELDALIARADRELEERVRRYRGSLDPVDVVDRTVIAVDDGLATGRSALAAVGSLRKRGAARVILAAPVASRESVRMLAEAADAVVCVEVPPDLWAVGAWYADFRPTSDTEVAELLAENARAGLSARPPSSR
jgi:putative phosphoribosyl transferase